MVYQDVVWAVSLAGMSLITLGFLYVIVHVGRPADASAVRDIQRRSSRWRLVLFVVLLIGFFAASYATLHRFPIPAQNATLGAQQVVRAVGRQWSWQLAVEGQPPGNPLRLVTGSPVEFHVTSADVNHGFAIYAPDGRVAIQTQAMPGFDNKVLYTFTVPGHYKVMCLEYCGVGHAPMATEFEVTGATGG
ncbi:MAG: cytochrome oxidase [Deltaproteobacteria bacterium]|nr:cytochrome oxidase [Deltaproteobacteria bacterium]